MVKTVYRTVDGQVFDDEKSAKKYEKLVMAPARNLKIYGHSDDIIMVDNALGPNVDQEYYDSPLLLQTVDGKEGMYVHVQYVHPGCWMVGISPMEEDEPLPDWHAKFGAKGYSTVLEISVPHGVTVTEVGP